MAEELQAEAAQAPKATKKLKYEDLAPNDTIVFSIVTQNTVNEEGIGIQLVSETVEKTATKAFWESLPEYPERSARKGQKLDITENHKTPKLVGYVKDGKTVKF